MMSRPRMPGFTLMELMVAVALFGIMVTGFAAFYSMSIGNQYRKFADLTVANDATSVRRAFDSAMGSATYIQAPTNGALAPDLVTWTNLDVDGVTPLIAPPAPAPQFTELCLDNSNPSSPRIFLYHGGYPMPAFSCGGSPAGVSRTPLAGGAAFKDTTLSFNRPDPDLIQLSCYIQLTDGQGELHSASVQTQAVVSANDQN